MMPIASQLAEIKKTLPPQVVLVAVSKTKPVGAISEAYEAGQRVFGENKIQEMTEKWQALPKNIDWHMIGHVQTNKVKYMAPYVKLVHGVDSLKLLKEINRQALRYRRTISCLLQIHIAEEDTKFGLDRDELFSLIASEEFRAMKNIEVKGLMGMATFTDNQDQVKKEFNFLKSLFDELKTVDLPENLTPEILSMGMSGDYMTAIQCGSTMVRIGSSIFGQR